MNSMSEKRTRINKNFMILALIVVIMAMFGIILAGALLDLRRSEPAPDFRFERERLDPDKLELHLKLKTALTFVIITISSMLIFIYYSIYRDTRTDFTLGLIVVMVSFLVYGITSNPIIPRLIGLPAPGFGLFTMIPDIFATVALFTLLYLSQK